MAELRIAPNGFDETQWAEFMDQGILVLRGAIAHEQVRAYHRAIDEVLERFGSRSGEYFYKENVVEDHAMFASLIDHPRHVGYAYDLYGELLKLHQSQLILRPPGDANNNQWHPDGPRAVPYAVFAGELPLQLKIGYWLTDLPNTKMGNLVVLPGSHRRQYLDVYDTHEPHPDEVAIQLGAGDMTIMHGSVWHRVDENLSDTTRRNIFVSYCPSWIVQADRHHSTSEWLSGLPREQRIIMRSYGYAYENAKPPPDDLPLFLDRESAMDADPGRYRDHVRLYRRKRLTWHEKLSPRQVEIRDVGLRPGELRK